jgi:hypothetical protein
VATAAKVTGVTAAAEAANDIGPDAPPRVQVIDARPLAPVTLVADPTVPLPAVGAQVTVAPATTLPN